MSFAARSYSFFSFLNYKTYYEQHRQNHCCRSTFPGAGNRNVHIGRSNKATRTRHCLRACRYPCNRSGLCDAEGRREIRRIPLRATGRNGSRHPRILDAQTWFAAYCLFARIPQRTDCHGQRHSELLSDDTDFWCVRPCDGRYEDGYIRRT